MRAVKKAMALAMSLALVLALIAGCTSKPAAEPTPSPEPEVTATPSPEPTPGTVPEETPADDRPTVNLGLLKGPTGMGAAKLLADNDAGETTANYQVTLGADPANDIVPLVVKGDLDIAAVPTNLASTLYQKTEGGVK